MPSFWAGLLVVALGAAMQASFTQPQKLIRGWAWEKMWLFYSIAGMIVFPWVMVAAIIPGAAEVYSGAGADVLARTALFGAGWGIGSVLFGLGIARVGVALAFAIIISLTAAVGALVPLAVLHPEEVATRRGAVLALGLVVVIAGVALCAKAGLLKESGGPPVRRGAFARGLAICIASGITSPMMNFAFAFGEPISKRAEALQAAPANAPFAIFAVAVCAGFLINAGYCIYLLARNRSWGKGQPGSGPRNTLAAAAMGALWMFGFYLYGSGAAWLGDYGKVVGWPAFMTVMVVVANIWGLVTGEWRAAGPAAMRYLGAGLAVLVVALLIISAGL